jgi:uncharacterized paraquat-inducible protein A
MKWPWQEQATYGCDGCGLNYTGERFKIGNKTLCPRCKGIVDRDSLMDARPLKKPNGDSLRNTDRTPDRPS